MLLAPEWPLEGAECGCDELQSAPRGGIQMFKKIRNRYLLWIGGIAAFAILGCSTPAPTPTPDLLSRWYSCERLADLAVELSQDEYPWIVQVYRLRRTVDTPSLTECSGSAEWIDDITRDIHVWAEEQSGGRIQYGYNSE